MYTYAYLHVTTRKSSTVTILLVTTRIFGWPACNSWPLIGRLTWHDYAPNRLLAAVKPLAFDWLTDRCLIFILKFYPLGILHSQNQLCTPVIFFVFLRISSFQYSPKMFPAFS